MLNSILDDHWAVSHSELNLTRPEEFLPERWLRPQQFPGDTREALIAAFLGLWECIGKAVKSD